MEVKRALVLIPARYASSRFPGKPLAQIQGKSMIQRVYENCSKAQGFAPSNFKLELEVAVVTDDDRIEKHVKEFGNVVRVDDDVTSGTLRIELAYKRYFSKDNFDYVVNVQGDEPLLTGEELTRLLEFHYAADYDITTVVRSMSGFDTEFKDPNKVKAIYSPVTGACHFFTRAAVPHDRDDHELKEWFLHIGVYSYKTQALIDYCESPETYYEKVEKLEQLRAIEHGLSIGAIQTQATLMGVDTPEDLKILEGVLSETK
ncbi:MAG: 3-deoxy-manno-octulosonate cytidylyltransferase [Bacteriovoracaceae bacterium]|nr:3-deoxy-manno-octulosonate cytidylyltransferase [Bacteriovoracaceae bacterium]